MEYIKLAAIISLTLFIFSCCMLGYKISKWRSIKDAFILSGVICIASLSSGWYSEHPGLLIVFILSYPVSMGLGIGALVSLIERD